MKLLVYSHFFASSIGGVETIVFSLARNLVDLRDSDGAQQFEITLVTETPAEAYDDQGFRSKSYASLASCRFGISFENLISSMWLAPRWHRLFSAAWFGNQWSLNITAFRPFAPTVNSCSSQRPRCVQVTLWLGSMVSVCGAIQCGVGLPQRGYGF